MKPKRLGIILMIAAVTLPVVSSAFWYRDAEAQVKMFDTMRGYSLFDRYELFKSTDNPGRYVIFGIRRDYKGGSNEVPVDDAVIRLDNGDIWESKGGYVNMLWGDPLLVAETHAPFLLLCLCIFMIGVYFRITGKFGFEHDIEIPSLLSSDQIVSPPLVANPKGLSTLSSALIVLPPVVAKPQGLLTPPGRFRKTKVVAIAGATLIIIVAMIWYFWQLRQRHLNPHTLIRKGDVTWAAVTGKSRGEVRANPNGGLKYIWIPPSTFMMGCSPGYSWCPTEEKPAHQVTITKGFWLGQTVVTVGAYKRFAAAIGRQMPDAPTFNSGWADDSMRIVSVIWDDGHDYCTWTGARLPTEAEWEYAARAGNTEAQYGPIDEVAWHYDNSGQKTHEVDQKRANGFGLYDMLGNVWEWVNDWYDLNYYQNSPSENPPGPESGQARVLRGGSWTDFPSDLRVSRRNSLDQAVRYGTVGFRCAG